MDKLYTATTSCHHGVKGFSNQLEPAKLLSHYDVIEIDFVFNGQYISSHDYDEEQIKKGSLLEEWIDMVMDKDKILWIDLKDDTISVFLPQLSKLNIPFLFAQLDSYQIKYPTLKHHLIISCQYHDIYNQLLLYDYNIMRDLPRDCFYVMDMLIPEFLNTEVKSIIQEEMIKDVGHAAIIAIDQSFFTYESLASFINQCTARIIIVYTLDQPIHVDTTKHIIYQYDY